MALVGVQVGAVIQDLTLNATLIMFFLVTSVITAVLIWPETHPESKRIPFVWREVANPLKSTMFFSRSAATRWLVGVLLHGSKPGRGRLRRYRSIVYAVRLECRQHISIDGLYCLPTQLRDRAPLSHSLDEIPESPRCHFGYAGNGLAQHLFCFVANRTRGLFLVACAMYAGNNFIQPGVLGVFSDRLSLKDQGLLVGVYSVNH